MSRLRNWKDAPARGSEIPPQRYAACDSARSGSSLQGHKANKKTCIMQAFGISSGLPRLLRGKHYKTGVEIRMNKGFFTPFNKYAPNYASNN